MLDPRSPGAGDLDPVRRGRERAPHLVRNQVRVVIDEQQVRHDALALGASRKDRKVNKRGSRWGKTVDHGLDAVSPLAILEPIRIWGQDS